MGHQGLICACKQAVKAADMSSPDCLQVSNPPLGEPHLDTEVLQPDGRGEEGGKMVWVQTLEGGVQAIPQEVAFLSPFFQREALHGEKGLSGTAPISLPKQITPIVLDQIIAYCQYHRAPGRSDKERKLYDEKYIRMDACKLCQLTSAADALDLRPLVDLASRALARLISGKTPEEIRATFNLPDDLTEEEKLEPVPFGTDEPRIRLLNRLYAKKRKELAERKAREAKATVAVEKVDERPTEPIEDTRSVDDLMKFIESGNDGSGSLSSSQQQGNGGGLSVSKAQPQDHLPTSTKASKKKKKRRGVGKKGDGSASGDVSNESVASYWVRRDAAANNASHSSPFMNGTAHAQHNCYQAGKPGQLQPQAQNANGRIQRSSSSQSGTSNSFCMASSTSGEQAPILDFRQSKRTFDIPDCPVEELFPEDGFEDEVCNPELDLEVADFARKLESDWSIRLQELISASGQRSSSTKPLLNSVPQSTSLPV